MVGSWVIAIILILLYLLWMVSSASQYACIPSPSKNGGSSIKSIPSWMPADDDLISANARITDREDFTFFFFYFDKYGNTDFPYSSMKISNDTFSFPFFCNLSKRNSTPILPPVICPSMVLEVAVSCGIMERII